MDVLIEVAEGIEEPVLADAEIGELVRSVIEGEAARLGRNIPQTAELSVSFVGADEMHELNLHYRGIDRPTDVLSFNIDDVDDVVFDDETFMIGDIVICPEIVRAQAPQFSNTVADETRLLLVHACLHLLGYDHETEAEACEMEELERAWLKPYVEDIDAVNIGPVAHHAEEDAAADVRDTVNTTHNVGKDTDFKSGFVALVGRPNAGKSTLINAIMAHKVVITSPCAQTTRHRICAVYNEEHMQIILVDTPGLHKPVDALGEELNISALNALKDADVVCMVVDGSQPAGRGDEWVLRHVEQAHAHKVLVITKADLIDHAEALRQIERAQALCRFDDTVVVSARQHFNLDGFLNVIASFLPPGPKWFSEDMQTDMSIETLIAEFIREKVLLNTRDEVPHSVGVSVDATSYSEKQDLSRIDATIYVEREGQKGIIIGAGGVMIKRIGIQARAELERLLGNKVMLKLNVKVKAGWRSDAAQIRRFGYGEGA